MASKQPYCFFPNGDLVQVDTPCFPDAEVSSCCRNRDSGWTCLPNGLCYEPSSGTLSRGTCTDSTWNSPSCPQYCTKNEFTGGGGEDFTKNGVVVWGCSNQWAAKGGLMCCDIIGSTDSSHNGTCCSGVGAINLFSIGSKPGNATSISLPSSSSSLSTFTSTPALAATSPSLNSTLSSHSTSSFSPTSSPAVTSNHSAVNRRTVAIAVSVSLGLVALLIIALSLIRHRRRKSNAEHGQKQIMEQEIKKEVNQPEFIPTAELSGRQEHEVPGYPKYSRHELQG